MESKEVYERFQTLGEQFRTCEAVQRSKYARLKTKVKVKPKPLEPKPYILNPSPRTLDPTY
jgi:hypothetical protein